MAVKVVKKSDGSKGIVYPQQIFMRLMAMASILKDSTSEEGVDTETMLQYELCTFPRHCFQQTVKCVFLQNLSLL